MMEIVDNDNDNEKEKKDRKIMILETIMSVILVSLAVTGAIAITIAIGDLIEG